MEGPRERKRRTSKDNPGADHKTPEQLRDCLHQEKQNLLNQLKQCNLNLLSLTYLSFFFSMSSLTISELFAFSVSIAEYSVFLLLSSFPTIKIYSLLHSPRTLILLSHFITDSFSLFWGLICELLLILLRVFILLNLWQRKSRLHRECLR